jgi:hypothetical protein
MTLLAINPPSAARVGGQGIPAPGARLTLGGDRAEKGTPDGARRADQQRGAAPTSPPYRREEAMTQPRIDADGRTTWRVDAQPAGASPSERGARPQLPALAFPQTGSAGRMAVHDGDERTDDASSPFPGTTRQPPDAGDERSGDEPSREERLYAAAAAHHELVAENHDAAAVRHERRTQPHAAERERGLARAARDKAQQARHLARRCASADGFEDDPH